MFASLFEEVKVEQPLTIALTQKEGVYRPESPKSVTCITPRFLGGCNSDKDITSLWRNLAEQRKTCVSPERPLKARSSLACRKCFFLRPLLVR
ncbi:MAG: hypothetical protein QOG55_2904 [Acidobacteriaceae bacterium]|nr:hypothetical protein [Acidobacteriaceae bacterium]